MNLRNETPRYSIRQAIIAGLSVGAIIGAIGETVASLRAPDAIAEPIVLKPRP